MELNFKLITKSAPENHQILDTKEHSTKNKTKNPKNSQVKKEIKREVRIYFELNENESTIYQICDVQLKQCLEGNL